MTAISPSLESILFASPTVGFHVNGMSHGLGEGELMFRNRLMNGCIIFKFPNFNTASDKLDAIPGMSAAAPTRPGSPVRTGIYVPKDMADLPLGGYGIYLDDHKYAAMMIRHLGMNPADQAYKDDFRILSLLDSLPSLDPFILKNTFQQHGISVHERYLSIPEEQVEHLRNMIAEKVKPIIAKALGIGEVLALEQKAQRFVEAIWDPTMGEADVFITAFGIRKEDAPQTFSAWKGVTFFQFEFNRNKSEIAGLIAWLRSNDSLPSDAKRLSDTDLQRIKMFRASIDNGLKSVLRNIHGIFSRYEESYAELVDRNQPKKFRDFLFKAENYYWTLGACNGVIAQVCQSWKRYCKTKGGTSQLDYETLERLLKVCDSVLRNRAGDTAGMG